MHFLLLGVAGLVAVFVVGILRPLALHAASRTVPLGPEGGNGQP